MVAIFHWEQKILFGLKIYQDEYCNYVVKGRYKENIHHSLIYVNFQRKVYLFLQIPTKSA